MMKNSSKLICYIIMAILFLTACQGFQGSNKGMLVESSSIVVDKYTDKNGDQYIETENNASRRKLTKTKVQDEGVWSRIELGDYITINHDPDGSQHIVSINKKLIYDNLTGSVTSLIQEDENFYVIFQFDQIGEEVIQFNEVEWNQFLVGEQVTFSVDSRGRPLHLTSRSNE